MAEKQLYTIEGYRELADELDYRKSQKREEIKEAIATARSFGDLSENSEYDEARNQQAENEARIKELETLIENADIIDESKLDAKIISLGSTVVVYDIDGEEEIKYSLVGSNETNPFEGKISDRSPVGSALMGAKAGQTVTVETPTGGSYQLRILDVYRSSKNDN